jgi:hypothetical protein
MSPCSKLKIEIMEQIGSDYGWIRFVCYNILVSVCSCFSNYDYVMNDCPKCQNKLNWTNYGSGLFYVGCSDYRCSYGGYVQQQIRATYKPVTVKKPRMEDYRVGRYVDRDEGYNEGLGMYIKSRDHKKQVLKDLGLKEVG